MISIEKFSKEHLDDVYKIECACFLHPWSKADLENQLGLDTSYFVVALDGETAVGYMGLQIFCGEGYVTNVAVLPEYRRQGIAQKLILKELENEMNFITLEVRKSNAPAINLYQKMGFENVGIRPRFYAEHLLGRFCRREAGNVFRILRFDKAHPARAAGGEHGKPRLLDFGQTLQKFASFLHDGEVGGEIRIENVVYAHAAERRNEAFGGGKFAGKAEALAPCGAHGGRNLHHGDLFGIGERVQNLIRIVPLAQGAGGTMGNTLSAERAVRLLDDAAAGYVHRRAGARIRHVPDMHILYLVAYLYAPHALDALVCVADQGEIFRPVCLDEILFETLVDDVEIIGEVL